MNQMQPRIGSIKGTAYASACVSACVLVSLYVCDV